MMQNRHWTILFVSCAIAAPACSSSDDKDKAEPAGAAATSAAEVDVKKYGLTPEQAAQPLATIGDTVITVGPVRRPARQPVSLPAGSIQEPGAAT